MKGLDIMRDKIQPADEAELEELEQIEKDLAYSFEMFRLTGGGYMNGTPASSQMAALQFVTRILAFAQKKNDLRIAQAITAAYNRGYNTGWQKSNRRNDHSRLPKIANQLKQILKSIEDDQVIANELSKWEKAE